MGHSFTEYADEGAEVNAEENAELENAEDNV
jgi:hypothetical protein